MRQPLVDYCRENDIDIAEIELFPLWWIDQPDAVTAHSCSHDALNGKDGICPTCGWTIQFWHNLGRTRDGGYIANPYGSIDPNPPKPPREYTEREIRAGQAIARALDG